MSDSGKPLETDIAALAATVSAPESLHRHVQQMVDAAVAGEHAKPSWFRQVAPLRLAGAMSAAAALTAVVIALVVMGGSGTQPPVAQAMALTLKPAGMAAPPESTLHRTQLDVSVEGVSFPYWTERFGWHSSGARVDRIDGRSVTTVFYSNAHGRRIGYAIVSGPAWAMHGGTVTRWAGVPYRLLTHDGATVVAWARAGHLCVVSGRDVSAATLLHLASWSGERPSAV